jgi:hypothetical protein
MRSLLSASVSALIFFTSTVGCAERHSGVQARTTEAPAAGGAAPAILPSALPASEPSASPAPSVVTAPLVASSAVTEPSAPPAAAEAEPPLTGPDGKTLPQTEERPSVESPRFKRRIERLAQAILDDEPKTALESFFPLLAYKEVKAIEKPERDYQYRLIRHFERDIHEYKKLLGAGAKFEGVDVPESSARWMKPGSEGNKLGYYRVLRSRLRFTKANGKQQTLELTSMISWRGEWYVVHLHGFE